jgi:phosphoenolpyruvate-protein phosphotransferase (PTS system enzyme I)
VNRRHQVGEALHGIGVSSGIATGPVYRVGAPPRLPETIAVPTDQVDAEVERGAMALTAVVADLNRRARAADRQAVVEILRAQAMMADDPVLRESMTEHIRAGVGAAHAIDRAFAAHREAFTAAGGYLAERVADLDDLRDRAVAFYLGQPMPGIPTPGRPFVLAARDLAPADTAVLDPTRVLALVTEEGGPTAHTAIVARTLGIPAVVRCAGVLRVADGATVAVDGGAGTVWVDPSQADLDALMARETERQRRLSRSAGPGRTADGHAVALLANIGSASDLSGASADAAEGVGLFRTELLYLDRTTPPTMDEEVALYTAVFDAAGGRRVVVRTLDAGADKPVPYLNHESEPNPALGVRGIRLGWQQPDLLRAQLAAIATAAGRTSADVWVMAPMVATPAEAARFRGHCRGAGLPKAGVMVEIPAAALRATLIVSEVDFISIGTNDLSQYTFAADRQCGELAELLDPWQPAMLELVARCAEAGKAAGKPVGVCGEAAADPALAVVMVGLGITSLSMAPRAIPAVREALAAHTLEECQRLAVAALSAPDATAARRLFRADGS